VPAKQYRSSLIRIGEKMSKQQAILETLLGAAELSGNRMIAVSIRNELFKMSHSREVDGHQRLARAAWKTRRSFCKAA
jgi:hypothetical protein